METTITGLFHDAEAVQRARRALEQEGFRDESITLLSNDSENLHDTLGEETCDGVRGMWFGGVIAAIGMGIGGAVISLPPVSLIQAHWLIPAGAGVVIGALSGALLGYFIGAITGQQVTQEYEAELARGGQLLAVNTDSFHAAKAQTVLERCGGSALSTAVHSKTHVQQTA